MNIGIASLVHINVLIKRRMLFNICLVWPLSKSLEDVLDDNLIGSSEAIKLAQLLKHFGDMNSLLLSYSATLVT